jgi:hypothetical protein
MISATISLSLFILQQELPLRKRIVSLVLPTGGISSRFSRRSFSYTEVFLRCGRQPGSKILKIFAAARRLRTLVGNAG